MQNFKLKVPKTIFKVSVVVYSKHKSHALYFLHGTIESWCIQNFDYFPKVTSTDPHGISYSHALVHFKTSEDRTMFVLQWASEMPEIYEQAVEVRF